MNSLKGASHSSAPDTVAPSRARMSVAEFAACAYIATVPFDGTPVFGRSLPFITGAVYVFVAVVDRLAGPSGRQRRPASAAAPALLALAFIAFNGLSYYWSVAPDLTFARLVTYGTLFVTSWLLAMDLPRLRYQVPAAYAVGAFVLAITVILAPESMDSRRTANGNANDVALLLLLGVACAVWLVVNSRGVRRWLTASAVPVLLLATIQTGSRTAVVGGALALAIVGATMILRRNFRSCAKLSVLVVAGWIAWLHLPSTMVPDRLLSIDSAIRSGNLSDRTIIWDAITSRGFTLQGIGGGAAPTFLHESIGRASVAHEVWLGILLETGAIGLGLFAGMIAYAAKVAAKSAHRELILYVSPVILAGTLSLSIEARRVLWFVIALAWATEPSRATVQPRRDVSAGARHPVRSFSAKVASGGRPTRAADSRGQPASSATTADRPGPWRAGAPD